MAELKEKGLDNLKAKLDEYTYQIDGCDTRKPPVRDFVAKYALLYANDSYDEIRKLSEKMGDIKQAKYDLMNSYSTAKMMDIPEKNIKQFYNC